MNWENVENIEYVFVGGEGEECSANDTNATWWMNERLLGRFEYASINSNWENAHEFS